jgi:hypothetical protein
MWFKALLRSIAKGQRKAREEPEKAAAPKKEE